MTITKRLVKGSAITAVEHDANLHDLDGRIVMLEDALGGASTPMDKIVEGSGSGTPLIYRPVSLTSGTACVFEVHAKAGERKRVNLYRNAQNTFDCTFDLDAGTATGTGATIEPLGGGAYKCTVSFTASVTGIANIQIRVYPDSGVQPYTGDGFSGLYVSYASFKADGVELLTSGSAFSTASWTKLSCSVADDAGSYRRLIVNTDAAYSSVKWAALGTSITSQNQYVPVVAAALGLTAQNLGVSGASLAAGSDAGALGIYDAIPSIASDTRLVTIEAGTNDFGKNNSTLGALGDTTTATFYGALYAAAVAIQAQAPSAKIVYLTPYSADSRIPAYAIGYTNGKGHTLQQFQTAVKEVAAYLGLPCINVGEEAGIGYLTGSTYTSDGLHLNATGGARFGGYVAARLRDLALSGMMAA